MNHVTVEEFLAANAPRKAAHRDKSHAMPMPVGSFIRFADGEFRAKLAYPPSDNSLLRFMAQKVNGKWRAMGFPSDEATGYRESVQSLARVCETMAQTPFVPLAGGVSVEVALFRPRRVGDVYRCKLLLDVLQGIAYENDSQVKRLSIAQRDDKEWPRVEVTVKALGREELFK